MKKFIIVLLNIVVVVSVVTIMYHSYRAELDSLLDVTCDYEYLVTSNSFSIVCNVEDEDSIISESHPLLISIFDTNNSLVFEDELTNGRNTFEVENLDNNREFNVKVEGYDYIKEAYIPTIYSEFDFSTVKSDIVIPTYVYSQKLLTDTEYHFYVELIDPNNLTESIDISLFDDNMELLLVETYDEFDNLDFSFTELDPFVKYSIEIDINYVINEFNEMDVIPITVDFITRVTMLIPSVEISNIYNNNVELSFDLNTNDNDASNVLYTIELIDIEEHILYSESMSSSTIVIDVSDFSGNYFISIKASYLINDSTFTDIELKNYGIYSNELSNFFLLPTVSVVDTDLSLTSYDEYKDYIFTFLNQGLSEFTIICDESIDCAELVTNDLYKDIPFEITDLVHAFNDINTINYSYSSSELHISVDREYSLEDMDLVDQEINSILNLIITESMTDFDKILSVHDYIINNTIYDSNCYDDIDLCDNDHTALGVLFDNNAVCEGYAHTMDLMLRALRIPTIRLSSSTHQWSAVYFDGAWFHLDATWDDPVTTNGENILSHDFFLLSTEELLLKDTSGSHIYTNEFINFME